MSKSDVLPAVASSTPLGPTDSIQINGIENVENRGSEGRKRSPESSPSEAVLKKKRSLQETSNIQTELEPVRTSRRLQDKAQKQILNKHELVENDSDDESSISAVYQSKRKKSKDKSKRLENDKISPLKKANGGLTNLGNTCFMNAVLQALFGMPVFISALKRFLSEAAAEEGSLLKAVNLLISSTENESREKALNLLRNIIVEKHQIFDNFDMHDAQEFLQILLQNLAAECGVIRNQHKSELECPISETFQISFQHKRKCSNSKCFLEQDGKEEFDYNLSMNVPDSPSSVQSCISNFFNTSTIQKTCSDCKQNIEHTQTTRLSKIPRVLIVHFQRLAPKFDEETHQFQSDKKSSAIDLSSTLSLKFVFQHAEALKPISLDEKEVKYAIESIEQMKKWENKKMTESTIIVEDNKKVLNLGPRAIKQLTEEQQLKLAMARSLQEDEEQEIDSDEICEPDSQIDYISKTETDLLKENALLGIAQDPILSDSYSLLATVNHHGTQADAGHYTADVLNPASQKWTSFNDSRVRTILEKTVKGRKKLCYMLFYMRKEYGTQLMNAYKEKVEAENL